jgi:hypothetical protein
MPRREEGFTFAYKGPRNAITNVVDMDRTDRLIGDR